MYGSFSNQLFQFSHYLVAFLTVFLLYPVLVFAQKKELLLDKLARNYLKMVFTILVSGYLLVILKLYEVIGIVLALLLIYIGRMIYIKAVRSIIDHIYGFNAYVYDCLDQKESFRQDAAALVKEKARNIKVKFFKSCQNPYAVITFLLLFVILAFSCYLRFYDAFLYPQPNMSDGAVTLSWIKEIEERTLFQDGIYPQGFSIYMATLNKFSFIDTLYILKYTGPFNEFLILIGIYLFTSRISGRKAPGVLAVAIYGLLYHYLPGDFVRQAATNSQEFGFVFLFPTLYFYFNYLQEGDRNDLVTAFCGLAVTGLVHTVAFAFVGLGFALETFLSLLMRPIKTGKRVLWGTMIGFLSILLAVAPAIIGHYLLKIPYYSSSADYAGSFADVPLRTLARRDYLFLIVLAFLFLCLLILIVKKSKNAIGVLFTALFSLLAFLIYYAGGTLTRMSVVRDRSIELISLLIPVAAGIAVYLVLQPLRQRNIRSLAEAVLCGGLVVYTALYIKPAPIIPYKMMNPSAVQEYLKISQNYLPTQWVIVSYDETYNFVRGKGYHILSDEFVKDYSPGNEYLKNNTTGQYYKEPYVFLYYEKNLYYDGVESMTYTLKKRKLYNDELKSWIDTHRSKYSNLTLYDQDKNFEVYLLDQSKFKDEIKKEMWA